MSHDRPLAILICALGGEGGGVLAEWLVETAITAGHSVQSTSIPGVAQRTGATTYYVEVFPQPDAVLNGRRPVFSLTPVPGALDLLASSELLETARQVAAGFASRERTQVITSTARALTTAEKMVPGDGRADRDALLQLVRTHSTSLHGVDMTAIAQRSGTVISAVLFGAIAASGVLPFPVEAYWRTIRGSGKGVEASLRGFDAAYEAVLRSRGMPATRDAEAGIAASAASGVGADADARSALDHAAAAAWKADFPVETHAVLALGCARVREYQDARYAQLYLARVARALAAERAGDPTGAHGYATTRETARHLALWMAFDDIVRVAELKCRAARFERVRGEVRAGAGELLRVHDHFKPGVPEFAALLPAGAAAVLLRWEQRRIARGRAPFAWALQLPSHTVIGMLALRGLAALKGLRRRGSRYATEQALIERWLAAVERGAREDAALGRELAECGRLVKGYGATRERGLATLLHLMDTLAFRSDRAATPAQRAAGLAAARRAALADDAGRALDRALAEQGAAPRPPREQPIHWVGQRPGGRAGAAKASHAAPAAATSFFLNDDNITRRPP